MEYLGSVGSVGSTPLFVMAPSLIPSFPSPENLCFWQMKSLLIAQFSTYKHRTRFIVKRKQVRIEVYRYTTYTFLFFIFKLMKIFFHVKNMRISKKSLNFIVHYNCTEFILPYTYLYTKCNDIFKFSVSLKLNEEQIFLGAPPRHRFIFYSSFSLWFIENRHKQKHFLEVDLHVLFITFFSKMCNKQNLFHSVVPFKPLKSSVRIYYKV